MHVTAPSWGLKLAYGEVVVGDLHANIEPIYNCVGSSAAAGQGYTEIKLFIVSNLHWALPGSNY